jgi:predicted ATPase/class 3 adenylate cyclase
MATAAPKGTVTLMFSDIEGSTRLLRRLGDVYSDVLSMHHELVREAFGRHRGYEVDMQGDAFFVTFGSANDAVAAAADVQRALATHDWPDGHEIRIRIGLHTGEPSFDDGRYVGIDVHHGARVMAAGHGGQVLVSESTRALLDERVRLHDLGEHRLKDISEPQRLYQLEIEGLPAEFPPLKTVENRPTNLPAPTSTFIGRERELAEVDSLLAQPDVRLLTLTGTGGAGKTRLALQVAADMIEHFSSGVFFVSLSPVRDWELVVPAIARALGLREYPGEPMLDTLTDYVRDKELLLVLDNVEQVLAAGPAIAGLLALAPGLRVLTTSRVPLNLSGESTYAVPPLALPASQRLDVAELGRSEAVRLFVDRAHAATTDFTLTSENAEAVAEICRRLDGLPLAIELAAPRVRVLTPSALLRRLDQRLTILTGGAQDLDERQRTLRATIEWSHELLLDDEKARFARLGSLVGGCRLEAAEALCDLGGSLGTGVLDGLGSLVDKSLLRRTTDSDGEPRFWMLETIREFALEMLRASGEADEARRVHAHWYADEAERLDIGSRTGERARCIGRLDDDYANFSAAIAFARDTRDGELMLRLVTALWGFWSTRGYVAEGRGALEDAFELADRRPPRALLGLCTLRVLSGTSEGVLEDAREAMRACEELGDDFSLAQAWNLVGRIEGGAMGHMRQAEEAFRNALAYAERGDYAAEKAEAIGWLLLSTVFGPAPAAEGIVLCDEFAESERDDPTIQAWCSVARGVLEAMSGEFERARELLAAGTRALEELGGLTVWAANTAQEAFLIENIAGTPAAATETLRLGYETLDRMGERGLLSTVAGFLAQALCARGDYEEAARFSRACEDAAATDDVFSQMLWRISRAKILVRQGDVERAESLAREAVRLGESTDLLNTRADMLCDLAEVLCVAGRRADALPELTMAARLYEQKGNAPGNERALRLAAGLSPASSSA